MKKIVDLYDPKRVDRDPDCIEMLLQDAGDFRQDEFKILRVELRLYIERYDKKLGNYTLITSFVETDRGSVEMVYDEGFRGDSPLIRIKEFLVSNLGISSLVLRAIIALRNAKE